ncbi:hypothetical protein Tco_0223958 [Tanacetum coccineum]
MCFYQEHPCSSNEMCPFDMAINGDLSGRIGDLDNSTSNVLIPLDSWTSGLLVYKLPLSVEYGVSTSIGYGISSSLSNIAYPSQLVNMAYPLPLDMAYLRMTKVIKGEFKKIKDVKVEDVPLTCDASLEVFNDKVRRLSKMADDLFTYEIEVANIPCDSKIDNDSEQEADDDMGYDPSNIRGDDEVELTDEESSDNDDEIVEVFRIENNIFDYEIPLCSTFNEFNYLLKDYKWYEALEDCKLKDKAIRNKAIMEGSIKEDDDESRYEQKRQWNTYTSYDDAYEINHKHNKSEELCEIYELPVCNIKRYMMIKYSFNDDEEYVVVKEVEYNDLTVTRKEACRAYQEIFWIIDEGWMDLEKEISMNISGEFKFLEILKCWSLETSRVNYVKSRALIDHLSIKATWLWKKAQGEVGFTLGSLREVAQAVTSRMTAWQSLSVHT